MLADLFSRLSGRRAPQKEPAYVPSPLRRLNELVDRPRLSAWLPYSAYLLDEQVFVNEESIGFVLESTPQAGADEQMADVLHSIITACPAGTGIQITLFASPNIRQTLRDYGALRVADADDKDPEGRTRRSKNIHRTSARRRAAHYMAGTSKSLVEGFPYLLRAHRLIFSFALPGGTNDVGKLEQLLTLREGMRATLGASGFHNIVWNADHLVNWVADILNPDRLAGAEQLPLSYDPDRDLRAQLVSRDTVTVIKPSHLLLQKADGSHATSVRFLSVKNYPKEFQLWQAGALAGDLFQVALQYPCPFMITLGVHIPDQDAQKAVAAAKGARATQMHESDMGKLMPEWREKRDDWQLAMQAIGRGEFMVKMYHQIALFSPPRLSNSAEHAARAIWRARGFELVSDTFMQIQALLASLPLALTQGFADDLMTMERIQTKTSMNAINTAPLVAEWTGTGTPALLFGGRRGALMAFDLFDNTAGNFNFALAGAPGSGKSVLMNEIIEAFLGMGRLVRIVDMGRSYQKQCELLGGTFLDFHEHADICLNPFSMLKELSDDDMAFLKPLFLQMIAPGGYTPRGTPVSDFEKSHIETALRAVWYDKGSAASITDVAEYLKTACKDEEGNCDPRVRDLGFMLFPFTIDGMHGKWFNGPANVDLSNQFVVLELQSLGTKKELQSVVLFTITYRVMKEMEAGRGKQRGLFGIDEGWRLLDGGMATDFIEVGTRTARKWGWSFGTATQGVNDYYKTPGAQASLENADWLFLLRQKEESIETVQRAGRLSLNEHLKRMLLSLRTEKGQFSEVFIHSPMGSGVGRLLLDPFSLLLYSSTDEDYAAVQNRRERGMTLVEAIEDILRERGLG